MYYIHSNPVLHSLFLYLITQIPCDLAGCSATFSRREEMLNHFQTTHPVLMENLEWCPQCNKPVFQLSMHLKVEILILVVTGLSAWRFYFLQTFNQFNAQNFCSEHFPILSPNFYVNLILLLVGVEQRLPFKNRIIFYSSI